MHAQLRAALDVDRDALDLAAGLRVAVSVAVPVALGLLTGREVAAIVAGLSALNLALAEGVGNYSTRALTLAYVLTGNAVSIEAGTAAAMAGWWAVPILFSWVLLAAYAGVIGPVAERTGWFAALMFMIGLGLPDPSLAHAIGRAGLLAGAGLWSIGVIVLLWPFHPHRPVLRAVGCGLVAVGALLELVARSAPVRERDRAIARAEAMGHEAEVMTRWRTLHDGRFDAAHRLHQLTTTAERATSDAVVLDHRLRESDSGPPDVAMRAAALRLGRGLTSTGEVLRSGREANRQPGVERARWTADEVTRSLSRSGVDEPALRDLCTVLSSLAEPGYPRPASDEIERPGRPKASTGVRAALRANLSMSSFWFRYAARFALAAAAGLAIALGTGAGITPGDCTVAP